jgi:hypothetical protein
MFIKNYKTTKCINGCKLFNDDSKFLYWEKRNVTYDECQIVNLINSKFKNSNLSLLHVGVGNSFVANNLNFYKNIDGISISGNEISHANSLNIKNYKVFFANKLEKNIFHKQFFSSYDIIIDVNIKSFCCCDKSFINLIKNYSSILNKNGLILTGKKGMNWSRIVKPVLRFSFKRFFYKRLKEFDGPSSNCLSINNLEIISKKFDLNLKHNNNENTVILTKT